MEFGHRSVLLQETIDGLAIRPDGIYVDGTLGGGGHSLEVCKRLGPKGSIVGIDQDADAIKAAGYDLTTAVLVPAPNHVEVVKTGDVKQLDKILNVS